MFKRRTVFVIGAGAGQDIDMPLGKDLAKDIAKSLDLEYDSLGNLQGPGDKWIINAMKHAYATQRLDELEKLARTIRDGIVLADSIDDFLDLHKESELVVRMGKLAIVRSIVRWEKGSKLAPKNRNQRTSVDVAGLADTWLAALLRSLHPGTEKDRLFDQVTFINFNYDRCLEQFLEHALPPLLSIEQEHALDICRAVKIYHPYGSLGPLPTWTKSSDGAVAFGEATLAEQRLLSAAGRIKTYTEREIGGDILDPLRAAIKNAEQIVFLGFAFHEPNMKLLQPEAPSERAQIFATAIGIGEEDRELVRRDIGRLFTSTGWTKPQHGQVRLRDDIDCLKMFTEYHRVLRDGN